MRQYYRWGLDAFVLKVNFFETWHKLCILVKVFCTWMNDVACLYYGFQCKFWSNSLLKFQVYISDSISEVCLSWFVGFMEPASMLLHRIVFA